MGRERELHSPGETHERETHERDEAKFSTKLMIFTIVLVLQAFLEREKERNDESWGDGVLQVIKGILVIAHNFAFSHANFSLQKWELSIVKIINW